MMRWRRGVLVVVPMIVAALAGGPTPTAAQVSQAGSGIYAGVAAQLAPYCQTSEPPAFKGGFAQLATAVGAPMGTPTECPHVDEATGDIIQNTTTGLAYYRAATGIPTFTNGSHRWALTQGGLLEWDGQELDPPSIVAPGAPAPPPVPAAPGVPGVPEVPTVPGIPEGPGAPMAPEVPPVPAVPEVPPVPAVPGAPEVPGAPAAPAVPGAPAIPAIPGVPAVPAVPAVPKP